MTRDRSIYFATPKDLFDILSSARQRITKQVLLEIGRDRGIYLSEEDKREELIEYISLLPHSAHQLKLLLEQTENSSRQHKKSVASLELETNVDEIHNAFERLNETRAPAHGETYQVRRYGDNRMEIEVTYTEFDYSRTRLKQKQKREAKIEIDLQADLVQARYPATEKGEEIAEALFGQIRENNQSVQPQKIEISSLSDPEERTTFFFNMITGLRDFEFQDATKISVDRLPIEEEVVDDEEREEEDAIEEEGDGEEREQAEQMVRKMLIHGRGLLHTPEYQRFRGAGFFLSGATWISVETVGQRRHVEFEASFSDPKAGTGFRYAVKGLWRRTSNGELTVTRRPPNADEQADFCSRIEKAAWDALENRSASADEGAGDV